MENYKPIYFNGKTLLIHSYLVLESQECDPRDYSIFNTQITQSAKEKLEDGSVFLTNEVFDEVDRGFSNTFKYFEDSKNKKIYLYSKIISNENREVIFRIESSKNTKFWLNNHCMTIHNGFWAENFYVRACLQKGENDLLVEKFSPQLTDIMSVQILDYAFERGNEFRALSNIGKNFVIDSLMLRDHEKYIPIDTTYEFMYLAGDKPQFQEAYEVEVRDEHGTFITGLTARLNKVCELSLDQVRACIPNRDMHVIVKSIFRCSDGGKIVKEHKIVVKSIEQRYAHVLSRMKKSMAGCGEEIRNQAGGNTALLEKLYGYRNYYDLYFHILTCEKLLSIIDSNCFDRTFYKKPGVHTFYMKSKLDQSYVQMKAHVPDGYTRQKRYPVIFMLLTGYGEYFSDWLELELLPEPILCFDVPGRGYTGGSYIGEASTLEIINWVKVNYSIDENRIYIIGQSNGGFACYSVAQNHPSLPAAIFPMISYPNIKQIRNLSNIPTVQLVSPKDYVFHGRENQVKDLLTQYGNYRQYDFKEMLHAYFRQYIAHRVLLKQITSVRRDPYPGVIRFKTYRNRHLQSYYLKINGIRPECEAASIFCRIADSSNIMIRISGSDSFTIELPPQINRERFNLTVNNKRFSFCKVKEDKLIFVKNKCWMVSEVEPEIDFRKGTGLLDVYLDTLHIVLPNGEKDAFVMKTAENFSKPVTNGFFPEVEANYPVITDAQLSQSIAEKNLIVIDVNQTSETAKTLKQYLKIGYDRSGYWDGKEKVTGRYVLMQVIANPKNPQCSVLVISTNNSALFQKHILLRKVILPTYSYGLHPMWNKEMLIFHEKYID